MNSDSLELYFSELIRRGHRLELSLESDCFRPLGFAGRYAIRDMCDRFSEYPGAGTHYGSFYSISSLCSDLSAFIRKVDEYAASKSAK